MLFDTQTFLCGRLSQCQPQIAEENQQNQKCGRMMSVSCSGFGPWLLAAKHAVMSILTV